MPELRIQSTLKAWGSDHIPFLDAGVPAVLTIEGADRESEDIVHSSRDTVSNLNGDLAASIIKMNAAFVAAAVQTAGEA